jgi:sigma-B regulation protein RsbU (phosphoserine phosphatase)
LDKANAGMTPSCDVQPRILIADDQPDLLDALRLMLKAEGIQMEAVTSPEATLSAVTSSSYDLLLMDLNYTGDTTSGREGIDLVSRVRAVDRLLPVVVMTGWGSVDLAVEAMRRGVRNFVQKPWDNGQLIATLRAEIEEGRARRLQADHEQRELQEALRIQRKLLPASMPAVEGLEIATSWQPASGVGGDCYDAISFGPTKLAVSIADVVGKGIPAALLMSNLQATVRAFATEAAQAAELCQQTNRVLCGHIAEGRFISFFYCVIDSAEGTLTYCNAGHYPPILVRANGEVEHLSIGGAVLGILPAATYPQGEVTIRSGDRLVLYTDGISEARRGTELISEARRGTELICEARRGTELICEARRGTELISEARSGDDEFGEDRLISIVVENRACSAPTLQARLSEAVASFSGGRFQDDATLIVIAVE